MVFSLFGWLPNCPTFADGFPVVPVFPNGLPYIIQHFADGFPDVLACFGWFPDILFCPSDGFPDFPVLSVFLFSNFCLGSPYFFKFVRMFQLAFPIFQLVSQEFPLSFLRLFSASQLCSDGFPQNTPQLRWFRMTRRTCSNCLSNRWEQGLGELGGFGLPTPVSLTRFSPFSVVWATSGNHFLHMSNDQLCVHRTLAAFDMLAESPHFLESLETARKEACSSR